MHEKWIKLSVFYLLMLKVQCGFHTLEFLSTGRAPSKDRPAFEQLTLFDRVPISHCDIKTRKEEVKPLVETQQLAPKCEDALTDFFEFIDKTSIFINKTVDVVQRRRVCVRTNHGGVTGSEAWAVNSMDFLTFNPKTQRWTSHSPSALTAEQLWNKDKRRNLHIQHFLRQQCPEIMQTIKLKSVNKNTEVQMFGKPTVYTNRALLMCHVTTSDTSARSVHLVRDAAPQPIWTSVTGPVPSGDGCVILRLTALIDTQKPNTYGCTVQTGSNNVTVYWNGKTLDGTDLSNKFGWKWKIQILLIGLGFTIFFTIVFCGIILSYVKRGALSLKNWIHS